MVDGSRRVNVAFESVEIDSTVAAVRLTILLPSLTALTVHERTVAQARVNFDVFDFESLVVEFLPQLNERVFDNRANLRVVAVETCVDRAVVRDGNAKRQFAQMFGIELDDHFGVFGRANQSRLTNDLSLHVEIVLRRRRRSVNLRRLRLTNGLCVVGCRQIRGENFPARRNRLSLRLVGCRRREKLTLEILCVLPLLLRRLVELLRRRLRCVDGLHVGLNLFGRHVGGLHLNCRLHVGGARLK